MRKKRNGLLKKIAIGGLSLVAAFSAPFAKDFSPRKVHESQRYTQQEKIVAAHRAGTEQYHGNSLEAIRGAESTGAEFVELDVRKAKDSLVVYHDRTLGGKSITSLSYKEASKIAQREGYTLPNLEQALDELRDSSQGVILDLKNAGNIKKIIKIAKQYLPTDKIIISSEDPVKLARVKKYDSKIKTTLIIPREFHYGGRFVREKLGIVPWGSLKKSGADYVSVNGERTSSRFYENASKGDVGVLVYGIDEPEQIETALDRAVVKGVIVKNPSLASETKSHNLEKIVEILAVIFVLVAASYARVTGSVIGPNNNVYNSLIFPAIIIAGLLLLLLSLRSKQKLLEN